MSNILRAYEVLSKIPFGKHIASRIVTFKAPYFSTIKPLIIEIKKGRCSIIMKDRRAVHNHIKTIHAIAMCNLCELTMGMALVPSLPRHLRWIAKGMKVNYVKKAKGAITGTCEIDIDTLKPGDLAIPIIVRDESYDIVTKAEITVYITELK